MIGGLIKFLNKLTNLFFEHHWRTNPHRGRMFAPPKQKKDEVSRTCRRIEEQNLNDVGNHQEREIKK